jgi:hypothetical protein
MSEAPHSHAPAGTHASRASLTRGLLAALDGAILLYALATALFLAFGGLDLVVVSVRRFSKPALLLLVLVAVRAALPRHSWLSLRLRAAREQARVARARLEERSP